MSNNTETFIIQLKDKGVVSGLRRADRATDRTTAKVNATKASVNGLGTAFAGLLAAGIIGRGISKSIDAFDKQDKAVAQVRAGLESTGGVAGKTLDELTAMASDLQKKTIFGDEDILQNSTAQLLTFTSIAKDNFGRTQEAALDLATRLGGDLKGATLQLGKALNDPAKGMSALSRSGISFTNQQTEVIKKLQETGRLGEAQTLILDELEKQYGGSAEAAAKAGKGGLTQFGNVIGDVQEQIGGLIVKAINPLLPALFAAADAASSFFTFLDENGEMIATVAGFIAGAVAPTLAVAAAVKIWTAYQWLLNVAMTANPVGLVVAAIAGLIAAIVVAYYKFDKFRAVIQGAWAVIKQVATNIKDTFTAMPSFIIRAFNAIPNALKQVFSGVGELFDAIFSGDFEKIPDIIKNTLVNNDLSKVGQDFVKTQVAGAAKAGAAFVDAYDKEIAESKEAKAKKAEENFVNGKGAGINDPSIDPTGDGKGGKNNKGAGISEIKASAPKTFNINIESLIKEQIISTTNLTEGAAKIKDLVTRALLTATNDAQIIAE